MVKRKLMILACALFFGATAFAGDSADDVKPVAVAVSAGTGTLTLENNTDKTSTFTVYSITGQVVKTVTLKSDSLTVALPQGFYIVKSEDSTVKVVVK